MFSVDSFGNFYWTSATSNFALGLFFPTYSVSSAFLVF